MRLHSIFIITLSKSDVHDILCKSEVCFQDSMTGSGNGMVSIGTQSGRRFACRTGSTPSTPSTSSPSAASSTTMDAPSATPSPPRPPRPRPASGRPIARARKRGGNTRRRRGGRRRMTTMTTMRTTTTTRRTMMRMTMRRRKGRVVSRCMCRGQPLIGCPVWWASLIIDGYLGPLPKHFLEACACVSSYLYV